MFKNQLTDKMITVIGGGPSGMMSALSAAKKGGVKVRLLEKNEFLGKKLLATGNGRCNLTNINCPGAEDTLRLFSDMGLLTKTETEGRVYPYAEQASAVRDILVNMLRDFEVEVLCGIDIQSIDLQSSEFIVSNKNKAFASDAVILTTGGKAGPQYGSTGEGYRFARKFGHSIVRTMPSLVQMTSDSPYFPAIKGVRAKGRVELVRDGQTLEQETGEIQFTEGGPSGICIFNLSKKYCKGDKIRIDLFPDYGGAQMADMLSNRREKLGKRQISELLLGMVNLKLIPVLLKELHLDEKRLICSLTPGELADMARLLTEWTIPITGTKGWKEAQVTSGGIDLSEIDLNTMESKLTPKLYFAGEILDFDGKCGGYNLQWAWSSGRMAGEAAATALGER